MYCKLNLMARLSFDTDHLFIPVDEEQPPLEDGNGFYGAESWLSGSLDIAADILNEYSKIRIEARFISQDDEKGPTNPHTHSRVGIWLPICDLKVDNPLSVKKEFRCVSENEFDIIHLIGDSWKFGKTAVFELRLPIPSDVRLTFQTCILPCFKSDLSDSLSLKFKIYGYRAAMPIHPPILEKNLLISRDDKFPIAGDDGDIIDTFIHLGAYETKGLGNSLHPKQLLTADALRKVLSEDKAIKVCYIGPDTTENICSLLRIIGEDENLKSRIRILEIYSHEEWDEELFNKYGKLETNIINNESVKVQFSKISESNMISEPTLEEVIVIATYVTPWATKKKKVGEPDISREDLPSVATATAEKQKQTDSNLDDYVWKNKKLYKKLLQLLLHNPNSKLISVDPKNGDFIARSALNCERTNMTDFYYEELKLIPRQYRDLSYDTAIAKVWSQPEEAVVHEL